MKIYFAINKIICLLLCFFVMLGAFSLTACSSSEDTSKNEEQPPLEQYALALRAITNINIGDSFSPDNVEVVRVRTDALPCTTYSVMTELCGKYATSAICVGDFITEEKVTDKKPEGVEAPEGEENITGTEDIDPYELGYVIITEYLSSTEDEDCAPAIQQAIEKNPGRTIYFPDGKYIIKSPIVIPTDPSKSVSLRLSNHAIITAADWGDDKRKAMIQIGCDEDSDAEDGFSPSNQRSISIIGGCIYGSRLASGIAIGGGKDTYIYNVSIKQVFNGIHIKRASNELGATYANVDNVNISGMGATNTAGVLVEGSYNTFSNMRIASVNYGVLCTETGSNNVFRNLHPLVVSMQDVYTVGFWDKSEGNVFDVCYSDQFSAGYRVEENTRSLFIGCFSFWYSEQNNYHVGYESTGKFNSIISAGKVYHRHGVETEAYLYIGAEGGQGVVLYPINSIQPNIDMLKQHCKTEIILFPV